MGREIRNCIYNLYLSWKIVDLDKQKHTDSRSFWDWQVRLIAVPSVSHPRRACDGGAPAETEKPDRSSLLGLQFFERVNFHELDEREEFLG